MSIEIRGNKKGEKEITIYGDRAMIDAWNKAMLHYYKSEIIIPGFTISWEEAVAKYNKPIENNTIAKQARYWYDKYNNNIAKIDQLITTS